MHELLTIYKKCHNDTQSIKDLKQNYMFKLCLKQLLKNLCKLKLQDKHDDKVIFLPELATVKSVQTFS